MLSLGRRSAIACGILVAHVLVTWLLIASGRFPFQPSVPAAPPLIEIELTRIAERAPATDAALRPGSSPSASSKHAPQSVATPSDTGSIQAPAGAERESQAPTDWDLQADLAAQDIVSDLVKGEKRKCSDSPTRPPWLGPCTRWGHFAWSEEPKRAGFQSGIPYLRLGKGCVLVLGFVGCAFGASKANGHLFDDLRDPDRDRSSVPDLSEINEPVDNAPQRGSVLLSPPPAAPAGRP
jgi:hypothetical protein